MQENQESKEVKSTAEKMLEETKTAETVNREIVQTTMEIIEAGEGTAGKKTDNMVVDGQRYKRSLADAPQRQIYLTKREFNSLKSHKYEEVSKKCSKSYVIQNKRTGMIVEIKAVNSCHACNMIGWKIRHCQVLEVHDPNKSQLEIVEVKKEDPVAAPAVIIEEQEQIQDENTNEEKAQ